MEQQNNENNKLVETIKTLGVKIADLEIQNAVLTAEIKSLQAQLASQNSSQESDENAPST